MNDHEKILDCSVMCSRLVEANGPRYSRQIHKIQNTLAIDRAMRCLLTYSWRGEFRSIRFLGDFREIEGNTSKVQDLFGRLEHVERAGVAHVRLRVSVTEEWKTRDAVTRHQPLQMVVLSIPV